MEQEAPAIPSSLGETCGPVYVTNACPIDEKVPLYPPEQPCFSSRWLQVHLGILLCCASQM